MITEFSVHIDSLSNKLALGGFTWLFFGCRHADRDFIFKEFFDKMIDDRFTHKWFHVKWIETPVDWVPLGKRVVHWNEGRVIVI